jgi:SAM-dependent methyltransferase
MSPSSPVTSGHREHFDKIASSYAKASDTWASVYRRISELVSPAVAGKDVLDIGNGGFFPYDTRAAKSVTVLDISPAMLDRIHVPNIQKVVGDARVLAAIPSASQDVVLYLLCLHHICGRNRSESLDILKEIFASAERVLRPGGCVIIAEPVTGGWVHALQKAAFGMTRRVLASRGVPMIFFHKADDVADRLSAGLGIGSADVHRTPLPVTGWVDPLGGSFPGLVQIPAWACPTRYVLFQAQKPV